LIFKNINTKINLNLKKLNANISIKKSKIDINDLLKHDTYKNKKIECCPICSGKKYIKYGFYKEIQRYKCKKCGKTFSNNTNLIWSYSKKDLNKWLKFIEFMIRKKSLRACAKKLHINLATAFYWRHKILHGLKLVSVPNKLKGDVHINKTIIIENFKGCKNITKTKRSNIWIIAAKGDEDSMLAMPIFKDNWNWNIFNEKIYSKIEKSAYIVSYKDRYIGVKAKEHNKKRVKEVEYNDRIKYIIRNLNKWLSNFKGIATKYLEEYLSLFILFNLDRRIDNRDIISYFSFGNRFIRTKEIGVQELKI
jgi:transposase-like protein